MLGALALANDSPFPVELQFLRIMPVVSIDIAVIVADRADRVITSATDVRTRAADRNELYTRTPRARTIRGLSGAIDWARRVVLTRPGQETWGHIVFASRSRSVLSRVLVAAVLMALVGSGTPAGILPVAGIVPVANAAGPTTAQPHRFLGTDTTANGASLQVTAPAAGVTLPSFQDRIAISGLTNPTSVRFSPDGRVFVAQKNGQILVYASLADTNPTVFADLRTNVDNYWDRGLLGMTLDPGFPTVPYVYVLYTYDGSIGGSAPTWNDACPTPPGPTTDGCPVSGRLSRLTAAGSVMTGSEQVLINGWCQQYPSHSVGDLQFGADGALYVSAGEGASFTFADYGQGGGSAGSPTPKNPCGDPPTGVSGTQTIPTAEGGSLRSQSLGRQAGEPVVLNGSILRVDPATGLGLPSNPLAASSDVNARRIVAYGLRNPFRFTLRPGTSEIWAGDVGDATWEEIDRLSNPLASTVANYGWPCYEGNGLHTSYSSLNLNQCSTLIAQTQRDRGAVLHLQPRLDGRRPARRVPPAAPRSRASRSTTGRRTRRATRARCSSPTTRATASGRCRRARTGCRTRQRSRRSWPERRTRSTSKSDPTATSSTWISRAVRSTMSRGSAATTRRRPSCPPPRPAADPH